MAAETTVGYGDYEDDGAFAARLRGQIRADLLRGVDGEPLDDTDVAVLRRELLRTQRRSADLAGQLASTIRPRRSWWQRTVDRWSERFADLLWVGLVVTVAVLDGRQQSKGGQ